MTIDELIKFSIKSGIFLIILTIADIVLQALINVCDRKEMQDQ